MLFLIVAMYIKCLLTGAPYNGLHVHVETSVSNLTFHLC